MECVQGEGGVNLINPEWAKAAAEAARNAGALVIADEVQTGMGRTGTLLASDWLGINPKPELQKWRKNCSDIYARALFWIQ